MLTPFKVFETYLPNFLSSTVSPGRTSGSVSDRSPVFHPTQRSDVSVTHFRQRDYPGSLSLLKTTPSMKTLATQYRNERDLKQKALLEQLLFACALAFADINVDEIRGATFSILDHYRVFMQQQDLIANQFRELSIPPVKRTLPDRLYGDRMVAHLAFAWFILDWSLNRDA